VSIKRTIPLLAVVALVAVSSAAAGSSATITISHEMKGCHMWQLGNGKLAPSLDITLKAGTTLRFVNNDIMPHRLIQSSGPKLALLHPYMNRLAAVSTVKLGRTGTYRFTTKPGEDYKIFAGHETIGEDYVLHLKVRVK
jgi:plastocyanin